MKKTIKYKIYEALQALNGRASHSELVQKYIEINPEFDKKYKNTKTPSIVKISGTIDSFLNRSAGHQNIIRNTTSKPYLYEIKG